MARRLVFVVGTRAQLIKIAPVVVECERRRMPCVLLMTGQHRETMQDLLEEFGVRAPQVSAVAALEHASVGSLVRWLPMAYRGVKRCLLSLAGNRDTLDVLVHGDTLSTLVGAFAARRVRARVIHLESGLTSGRLFDPFPEELCRRLVFRMTDIAMCPNARAVRYMSRYRGVTAVDTHGNTIVDAVALTGALDAGPPVDAPYVVASLHRFRNIYSANRLRELVRLIQDLAPAFVVHFVLHPATRRRLDAAGLLQPLADNARVILQPRMGYRAFLHLAAGATCVLTDGGSNQEELAVLGVRTIVMRAHTERPDGLGANALMEADVPGGVRNYLLSGGADPHSTAPAALGGPGPSERIVRFLEEHPSMVAQ